MHQFSLQAHHRCSLYASESFLLLISKTHHSPCFLCVCVCDVMVCSMGYGFQVQRKVLDWFYPLPTIECKNKPLNLKAEYGMEGWVTEKEQRKLYYNRSWEKIQFKLMKNKGTWLAQSVVHMTLNLEVIGLSPMLGVEIT